MVGIGSLRIGIPEYTETEGAQKADPAVSVQRVNIRSESIRVSNDNSQGKADASRSRWILSSFAQYLLSGIVETQEEHDA